MFKTEFSTWFGYTATENYQTKRYRFLGYFIQFFIIIQFIPNVVKFYRSAAIDFDIDLALESLIFVSTHFIINTQFYCCAWNASTLRDMSASLIQGMAQAITSTAANYYVKMDRLYFSIRKWFTILLFISTLTIILPPIIICLNDLRTSDTMTNEMCFLPIKISLPFEIHSLSVYLTVSVISAFSIWSMVTCKTMAAEVFYRYGLHLIARCRHLTVLLENVKTKHHYNLLFSKIRNFFSVSKTCFTFNKSESSWEGQAVLKVRLTEVINFHWKMLDFFQQYALATSGIIFFEFTTMIILLAAAGSSMVIKPPFNGDMDSIKFNFVAMSAVSSMFITSKMGSEISYEFAKIPNEMYSTEWVCWPIDFQRYAYVSLMLMQRPRYLTGYALLNCDLETFGQTMKTIISVILFVKEI